MFKGKISILILLFIIGKVDAQDVMYITILQDSAAVGEQVDLVITFESDPTSLEQIKLSDLENIQFYSASTTQEDSIKAKDADINITDLGQWADLNNDGLLSGKELNWDEVDNDGTKVYKNRIRMAFFDVGIYMFEGFSFTMNGQESKTNQALIKVTFKDYALTVVDSTGLAPIKNIVREPLTVQDLLPYLLGIIGLILIGYLIYRYMQNKKRGEEEPVQKEVVIIPPDVMALTALKELRQKELWQKGAIKQYQSELSHIIREYLEGRYHINALESTTRQIIISINDKSFTSRDQEKLRRILQISDLVKFAKAKPEINIHEEFMNDALEFVQRTRLKNEIATEEE